MAQIIKQFHRGRQPAQFMFFHDGRQPRPNVYKRSYEARETTDSFLRLAAGLDTDEPERKAKLRRVIKDALIILAAVGLIVAVWVL